MADYDSDGNLIPPTDAQSAREASLDAGAQPPDTGVGNAVVTISAPAGWEKYIPWLVIGGLVWWYLNQPDTFVTRPEHYSDED